MHSEKEWRRDMKTLRQKRKYVKAETLSFVLECLQNNIDVSDDYIEEAMFELKILKEFAEEGRKHLDLERLRSLTE